MKCKYFKLMSDCHPGISDRCRMYNYTDENCNIIKPKPKKLVRISRKAFVHPDFTITENPMFWGTFKKSKTYSMPVTVTFYKKYLKEKK